MRYDPRFVQTIKEAAKKAPVKRFRTAASMLAYLNKPKRKKPAAKPKRS